MLAIHQHFNSFCQAVLTLVEQRSGVSPTAIDDDWLILAQDEFDHYRRLPDPALCCADILAHYSLPERN
jgi:hypothetical protein